MIRYINRLSVLMLVLLLLGCTTINRTEPFTLPAHTPLAIYPFANHTATPQADKRAAVMVSHLLQIKHSQVKIYPYTCQSLLSCNSNTKDRKKIRTWAKQQKIRYALSGSINEWHYKVGLDGEPAISVTLQIIDVQSNKVVWSAVGSKVGGSRASLGGTAQVLLQTMLDNVQQR